MNSVNWSRHFRRSEVLWRTKNVFILFVCCFRRFSPTSSWMVMSACMIPHSLTSVFGNIAGQCHSNEPGVFPSFSKIITLSSWWMQQKCYRVRSTLLCGKLVYRQCSQWHTLGPDRRGKSWSPLPSQVRLARHHQPLFLCCWIANTAKCSLISEEVFILICV